MMTRVKVPNSGASLEVSEAMVGDIMQLLLQVIALLVSAGRI